MIDKQFEKEEFKKSVKENVKFLYRKTLEEATKEQIFQAVSYTVKDVIITTGSRARRRMKNRTRRLYIICPWSSLWAVPLETT